MALSSLVQLRENASDVNRHNIESYTEQVCVCVCARYEDWKIIKCWQYLHISQCISCNVKHQLMGNDK